MTTILHLLGRARAERDGLPVELSAKAAALLGYLAMNVEPQPRERVLGLLWGDSTEEAARKNLRNTLWAIRKDLGAGTVVTTGDRLVLHDGLQVDVREVLSAGPSPDARRLLDLYAGPFLDGIVLGDAPEFELWLITARERVSEAFLSGVTAGLAALGRDGSWREAASLARQALVHDPLHEGLNRALMQALSGSGERSEALRQYETLRLSLDRELGVEPSPESRALRDAISTGQAGSERAPARARTRRQLSAAATAQPEPPFIGRGRERAALDEELALASQGQSRVVLLTGELGIGKSRLWREWLSTLTVACAALEARCVEAASALPFAPLVELLASHPCIQDLFHPPSALPLAWLAEVSRLLPELRAQAPGLPTPAVLPPEEERRRVFEAFVQALLALDAHPLLIFVDDVHWADRATLDWLPYLIHRMRAQPLLLVLAFRPEEAPTALVHQVATWGREGVLRRVTLGRLAPDETAALIARLNVDAEVTHRLQAQSAGNPYVLLELSRSLAAGEGEGVPPALADLVAARIDRLSEEGRSVIQAAGVLEPELDLAILAQTTGLDEDTVLDALDELLAARVLAERGGRLAFNHPLLSSLVRQRMSVARRRVIHRRAAQALESSHGSALGPFAGLIADHYAEAGDVARAAAYADLAADHSASLAAPAEAVAFRRRAWQLEPAPSRALSLAAALYRFGALSDARDAYEAALSAAEEAGDANTAARACLGMGATYLPVGWIDEVKLWAERSLRYLDATADPWAHAQAHFLLGAGRLRAGGSALEEAEADLAEAVRLAELHRLQDVAMVARFELGNARAERGDLDGAISMYRESADLARAAAEPNQQVLALNNLAYHTMLAGDLASARTFIEEAVSLAEQYDLGMPREYLLSTRGEIELADGRWAEAEGFFDASLAVAREHNNVAHVAKCRANLGLAAAGLGDLDGAISMYSESANLARAAAEPNQQVLAFNNLAYHMMLAGDIASARTYIEEAVSLAEQYDLGMPREYLLSTRGEIELADGRWAEAEGFFDASLAKAREHNNVAHVAKCRANLGLAAAGRGDLDEALILLEEAAELAAPLIARYMQAQIDLWLTEVYLARGERAAAAEVLARADARLAGSHYRSLVERSRTLRASF